MRNRFAFLFLVPLMAGGCIHCACKNWAATTHPAFATTAATSQGSSGVPVKEMVICGGQSIPDGWILITGVYLDGCGSADPDGYNAMRIEEFDDQPVNATLDVCATDPVPAGWFVVFRYHDRTVCGHSAENVLNVVRIKRVK